MDFEQVLMYHEVIVIKVLVLEKSTKQKWNAPGQVDHELTILIR